MNIFFLILVTIKSFHFYPGSPKVPYKYNIKCLIIIPLLQLNFYIDTIKFFFKIFYRNI